MRIAILGFVVILTVPASAVTSATVAPPVDVVFEFSFTVMGPDTAAGEAVMRIGDTETVGWGVETFRFNPPGSMPMEARTVHGTKELVFPGGTMTMVFQGRVTSMGILVDFAVVSGTGDYAFFRASGSGLAWSTSPITIEAVYSGHALFAR